MSKNTFQDMTREYFTYLDRLNQNDLNNYIVGLIHSSIINQCNWFLSRPMNQFHLEHAVNNHAGATGWNKSNMRFVDLNTDFQHGECYCWYHLSLQVIELLLLGRKQTKTDTYKMILPHSTQIMTLNEIAECLGLFRFVS